jgi:UDP-N-acetylmuramoyl-L-alanyl-D-glutamate--2,6-diaminopimelate ligase
MDFSTVAGALNLNRHPGGSGEGAVVATGVTLDSRKVKPGMVFVAAPGALSDSRDGHAYIGQALEAGATALIVERAGELPPGVTVPVWLAPNARIAAAKAVEAMAGAPTGRIRLCGITGTNGKISVAYVLAHVLEHAGFATGMIGTLGTGRPDCLVDTGMTTPEAENLTATFSQWAAEGITHATMEVSSHALATHRVAGLHFDVGAFTNLSQDHLDFHGNLDAYFLAKAELFQTLLLPGGVAVMPQGADLDPRLAAFKPRQETILSWARTGRATLVSQDVQLSAQNTQLNLVHEGQKHPLRSPLIGDYNVDNLLCAATCALAMGLEVGTVVEAMARAPTVPGRMEPVTPKEGAADLPAVIVDYAHTPDALERALRTCADLCSGRITVVFGCGGERDAGKRLHMGKAAAQYAARVVITDDNPRGEDPAHIREQILEGARALRPSEENLVAVGDREAAIADAIGHAQPGDLVLIAGKGHESTQTVGTTRRPFSDVEVARRILGEAA